MTSALSVEAITSLYPGKSDFDSWTPIAKTLNGFSIVHSHTYEKPYPLTLVQSTTDLPLNPVGGSDVVLWNTSVGKCLARVFSPSIYHCSKLFTYSELRWSGCFCGTWLHRAARLNRYLTRLYYVGNLCNVWCFFLSQYHQIRWKKNIKSLGLAITTATWWCSARDEGASRFAKVAAPLTLLHLVKSNTPHRSRVVW